MIVTVGPLQLRVTLWVPETSMRWRGRQTVKETSITASDWIGMFKGPNVCAQRFSHIRLCLALVCEGENLWVKKMPHIYDILCKWSSDRCMWHSKYSHRFVCSYYNATIDMISDDLTTCTVSFESYGNTEIVKASILRIVRIASLALVQKNWL